MGVQFSTDQFGPLALVADAMEALLRAWLWTYLKIFHFIRWRGLNNIPREGACLVTANHTSFYDPAVTGVPLRMRRVRFLAYHKYFDIPGIGALMRFAGAFPVDTAKADRSAYENSLRVLREDQDLIIIFPEGGRTRTRAINPLKPGAARLALNSGAWVVPVVVLGPERSWPYGRVMPRLFVPFLVKYYRPIRLPRPETKAELDEAIETINAGIATHWRRRIRAFRRLQRRRGKALAYSA